MSTVLDTTRTAAFAEQVFGIRGAVGIRFRHRLRRHSRSGGAATCPPRHSRRVADAYYICRA